MSGANHEWEVVPDRHPGCLPLAPWRAAARIASVAGHRTSRWYGRAMHDEAVLGTDVQEVLAKVRASAEAWAGRARQAEISGSIARETADEVSATGAHQVLQPRVFGGLEAGMVAHSYVMSVIGEVCMSTAWCAGVWGAHNWMLAQWPESTQQEIWGDDPTVRTSASIVPLTSFETDDDGNALVAGRFHFTSGCDHAHWFGTGGNVNWSTGPEPVIAVFPADHTMIDQSSWDVAGLAGTGSKDLVIEKPVTVDRAHMMSYIEAATGSTPGLAVHSSPIYRSPFRAAAALVLAGPTVGAARGAVRRFVERSASRPGPVSAQRIAEASALCHAAEAVLLASSAELDHFGLIEDRSPLSAAKIHRDTAHAVRLAAAATNVIFEASGGSALRHEEPIQRAWRDTHAGRNHRILTWDVAAEAYGLAVMLEAQQG